MQAGGMGDVVSLHQVRAGVSWNFACEKILCFIVKVV